MPLPVRQLAASEEACPDLLRPGTPQGTRDAHVDCCVSSQESTELEAEDALAWCAFLPSILL